MLFLSLTLRGPRYKDLWLNESNLSSLHSFSVPTKKLFPGLRKQKSIADCRGSMLANLEREPEARGAKQFFLLSSFLLNDESSAHDLIEDVHDTSVTNLACC